MTEAGGAPQLSGEEKTRYARHITLPEVGVAGQQRLKAGHHKGIFMKMLTYLFK